jgi:hypothetical protein
MATARTKENFWEIEFGEVVLHIEKKCGDINSAHTNNMGLTGLDIWDLIKRRPHFALCHPDLWYHFSGNEKQCQRIE